MQTCEGALASNLGQIYSSQLWEVADEFRDWVCSELRSLPTLQRASFRGDYVFVIDAKPRFIVMVDEAGAWSVTITQSEEFEFTLEPQCPFVVTRQTVEDCLSYFARTTINTDSQTLQKLLQGRLKAKIAFLTSKVTVNGDLAAFIKMVSVLKQKGVRPLASRE